MRRGIAGAGNWIVDHVKTIDVYPEQDRLANILGPSVRAGGGGAYNVLTNLARMKAPFPLYGIGVVGDDDDGRWLLEDAKKSSIDTSRIRSSKEQPTSFTDVMTVRSTGRRTFFHNRGANRLLVDEFVDPGDAKILYLAYLLLLDGIDPVAADVLKRVRALGVKTSVDVVSEASERFARIVLPVLDHVDYLILNEIEAGESTGHKIRRSDGSLDRDALDASAKKLYRDNVIVIHFPEGGFVFSKQGTLSAASKKVPEIKSTLGAGDAFCAGMLYGLHEDWPLDKALDLALRAAAACLSHETTTGGLRPVAEL
jgi:sugar/nucleoside kinase (ribokinase family)